MAACAPRSACRLELALALPPPWTLHADDVTASTWSAALLRGFHHDCSGAALAWDEVATPLTPPRVVRLDEGDTQLLWLQTHRLADGRVGGPVARVAVDAEQLTVQTLGSVVMPDGVAHIESRMMKTTEVVMIQSSTCDEAASMACHAQAVMLVKDGQRFVYDANSGSLDLRRIAIAPLAGGLQRRTRLQASVTFQDGHLRHEESVTVEHIDPKHADMPGHILREGQATRMLTWDGAAWHADKPSLWERLAS